VKNLIKTAHEWLLDGGYKIEDVSSGQGVPKGSRLKIEKSGEELSCVIKYSENSGRISFTRMEDGVWKVLSEFNRVLYVFHSPNDPNRVQILLFDNKTLLNAFESTFIALQKEEKYGYEIWLSPEKENGTRFLGSGYIDQAIDRAYVPLNHFKEQASNEQAALKASDSKASGNGGIMDEIKTMLASHLGVNAESIEIEVKIKSFAT